MKILYLITKSNFGGAQRYVCELASAFASEHEVVVAAQGGNTPGGLQEKLDAEGVRFVAIKNFQRDLSWTKDIRAVFELLRLFRSEKPDVVHVNSSKAGMLGAFAARVSFVPHVIFTAHGWPFLERRSIIWRLMAWAGSYITVLLSHKVIVVSHHDYLHTKMPFMMHKITVIPTAVPDVAFLGRSEARAKLYNAETIQKYATHPWLVTIAELTSTKNLKVAIDAVRLYNESHTPNIFYSIIGDGELRDELVHYIYLQGQQDSVKLLGRVDDARTYLSAFDMFVLSSSKEGMPYVVLEAGKAGLPVVASRVGGIPEVIEDGVTGMLADPTSAQSFADALAYLMHNPDKRLAQQDTLMQKINAQFSLAQMVKKTSGVYGIL